jgi:hypothetical protein
MSNHSIDRRKNAKPKMNKQSATREGKYRKGQEINIAVTQREIWRSVPCGKYHSSRRPALASPGRKLESQGWLSTFLSGETLHISQKT